MQLYTQSQIGSKVARIVRAAGTVEGELHKVLCSILDHTKQHGDYTQLVPLLNGLPNGVRKNGIVAWVKHFSGEQLKCAINSKDKTWKVSLEEGWDATLFDIEGAMAITFGDFTQEPAQSTVDIKLLVKLLTKHATNMEFNKDGSPKVDPQAREIASKLVATAHEIPLVRAALGMKIA